jgi:hypothetical protein
MEQKQLPAPKIPDTRDHFTKSRQAPEVGFPQSPQTKNHEKVESCFQRLE